MGDESKTVDMADFKKEARKRKIKEAFDKYVVRPFWNLVYWIICNPITAMTIIGILAGILKKYLSYRKVKVEQWRRDTEFWDPKSGDYGIARRPLTDAQYTEFMRLRKELGMSAREALIHMGLSKGKRR